MPWYSNKIEINYEQIVITYETAPGKKRSKMTNSK